jgi:hypothetical protein
VEQARSEGREAEKTAMQRPWGRTSLVCGWSRGSKGDRGTQRGDRQVVQGPVGCREDLGFDPEGGGSHGRQWAGEGPDSVLTDAP